MRRADHGRARLAVAHGEHAIRSLPLPTAQVDLWRVALDALPDSAVAQLRETLSADEEERARQFFFERDRRRFTIARGVLRTLLAQYLDCAPHDIAFRYGGNGKPELAAPADAALRFNVAHSEAAALLGFTRAGEIGVDLEHVRLLPDWEFIASTCFSPEERRRVQNTAPERRLDEFFAAWTRQEAMLKATGRGFGGELRWRPKASDQAQDRATTARKSPPSGMRASGARDPGSATHRADVDGQNHNPAFRVVHSAALRLYPIQLGSDFAATLVVEAFARWATCRTWPDHADPTRAAGSPTHRIKLNPSTPVLPFS